MFRVLAFCLALLSALCAWAAESDVLAVARVVNGKSFVLASGDTVRLAGIEAPNVEDRADGLHPARPGEPLGEEAKAALEKLLMGHNVRIENAAKRDRHNRILGQVTTDQGEWVQEAMLNEGWAMVYSFSDGSHSDIVRMLAAERAARAANRGIWAHPYFRVVTPAEAAEFVNRFKLIEGKVVSVNDYRGHTYINFSERWKGSFAVFISRKHAQAFSRLNLPSLVGKTIRVRGWIHYHNAPMMDLTHPEQIEIE